MIRERTDASRTAVTTASPRLFGVPVPPRMFGFEAGWQVPARGWRGIDLRDGAADLGDEPDEADLADSVRVLRGAMRPVPLVRTAAAA